VEIDLKIDILFKEYDSLRAEIRARADNQLAILGFTGPSLTWLLSRDIGLKFWIMLAVLVPAVIFMHWCILRAMERCAYWLKEIEATINSLAGAHLLEWESTWGAIANGYLGLLPPGKEKLRIKPFVRPT
jgi:hypothetical protein